MKRLRLALLAVLVVLAAIVAAVVHWGHEHPADADARARAIKLFDAMRSYSGTTALDQASAVTRYGGVRVVVARDTAHGRVIVLAVTGTSTQRDNLDWHLWDTDNGPKHHATLCFRWTRETAWGEAPEVTCPKHRDVDPARAHADPIPASVERRVRAELRSRHTAVGVRRALAGTRSRVAQIDGHIAVAVRGISGFRAGHPVNECLLGRRTGRTVVVWSPTPAQVAPGELPCTPATALRPEAQHAPH